MIISLSSQSGTSQVTAEQGSVGAVVVGTATPGWHVRPQPFEQHSSPFWQTESSVHANTHAPMVPGGSTAHWSSVDTVAVIGVDTVGVAAVAIGAPIWHVRPQPFEQHSCPFGQLVSVHVT